MTHTSLLLHELGEGIESLVWTYFRTRSVLTQTDAILVDATKVKQRVSPVKRLAQYSEGRYIFEWSFLYSLS